MWNTAGRELDYVIVPINDDRQCGSETREISQAIPFPSAPGAFPTPGAFVFASLEYGLNRQDAKTPRNNGPSWRLRVLAVDRNPRLRLSLS